MIQSDEIKGLAALVVEEAKRADDLPSPVRAALMRTAAGLMDGAFNTEAAADEADALLERAARPDSAPPDGPLDPSSP